MPQFHFDVHTTDIARDVEGLAFPDLAAAKVASVENARFLACQEMKLESRFSPNHCIKINDADGVLLHTTRYGDCIDVRL